MFVGDVFNGVLSYDDDDDDFFFFFGERMCTYNLIL